MSSLNYQRLVGICVVLASVGAWWSLFYVRGNIIRLVALDAYIHYSTIRQLVSDTGDDIGKQVRGLLDPEEGSLFDHLLRFLVVEHEDTLRGFMIRIDTSDLWPEGLLKKLAIIFSVRGSGRLAFILLVFTECGLGLLILFCREKVSIALAALSLVIPFLGMMGVIVLGGLMHTYLHNLLVETPTDALSIALGSQAMYPIGLLVVVGIFACTFGTIVLSLSAWKEASE